MHMAKVLTYPECVSESNRARLQRAVRNGPLYPGANSVTIKARCDGWRWLLVGGGAAL